MMDENECITTTIQKLVPLYLMQFSLDLSALQKFRAYRFTSVSFVINLWKTAVGQIFITLVNNTRSWGHFDVDYERNVFKV